MTFAWIRENAEVLTRASEGGAQGGGGLAKTRRALGLLVWGGRGRRLLLIFVSDPFLACDSLGPPLVELLGTNVDLLREKNLFRELKSVDAAPRLSILIVVLLRFGRRARRGLSVVWLFDEEEPQGFFDNGFLVRELAVLDLFSEPPLKIICKSDVGFSSW